MLRYFNVFGPRQDPTSPYSAVIPIFIKAALRDEPITIYGDGAQSRDFTYVKNVVDANLLALHTTPRCAILNIACGHSISLLELVDAISRLHGAPLDVRHADPRPGDVKHSRADCRLAEQVLGYRPSVTFDAGLQMTYDYYKQN
jgi:UDP-glucose 4-epimerase